MAKKIFIIMMVFSHLFTIIAEISTGMHNIETIILVSILLILSYILSYGLYKFISRNTYKKSRISFVISYKRLNYFMSIYLMIMIIYGLATGDGAAENGGLGSSSIFASLWVPDAIFYFYYCLCREEYKKNVWFNAIIYVIYKIILGWTGVIFFIAFYEMYYLLKDKKIKVFKIGLTTLALYVVGGVFYSYMYPLKYAIRYGTEFSFSDRLPVVEGISKLVSRLNNFSVSLFVQENVEKVVAVYQRQGIQYAEFLSAFRPIVPSALFTNKNFSSIGSCIYNAQTGYNGMDITNNCSIVQYYWLLFKCDPMTLFLCVILFIVSIYLLKVMCNWLQRKDNEFDMLFFWVVFRSFAICGTIENSLSNSYLKFIFFVPLLFFLGIIKIRFRWDLNRK